MLNLDLSRAVQHLRLHYAPDPSSQQACTIGGNVGTNAGGPHCLAEGVTSAHVLAVDVVLADGEVARLGGLEPDTPGYDLRGCFVGSEGTMGIATRIAVRLTPDPPAVATMLCAFASVDAAAATVSGMIAAGVLPGRARDDGRADHGRGRGLRRRGLSRATREAVLLVEVDGLAGGVADQRGSRRARSRPSSGATSVRVAADDAERALLWKGRKSAFGAIARIAPDYYLHDAVVPRTKLVDGAAAGLRDRRRARHHRDERLPRGRRQPASADRVRPARARRLGACARGRAPRSSRRASRRAAC